jgi:hypothetical protein
MGGRNQMRISGGLPRKAKAKPKPSQKEVKAKQDKQNLSNNISSLEKRFGTKIKVVV